MIISRTQGKWEKGVKTGYSKCKDQELNAETSRGSRRWWESPGYCLYLGMGLANPNQPALREQMERRVLFLGPLLNLRMKQMAL